MRHFNKYDGITLALSLGEFRGNYSASASKKYRATELRLPVSTFDTFGAYMYFT